jgi:hypothetical protein
MTTSSNTKPGPIEVWLSQRNMHITCTVVAEDETTTYWEVESLSLRSAQREMTGRIIDRGYVPDTPRWQYTATDGEVYRRFQPVEPVQPARKARKTATAL